MCHHSSTFIFRIFPSEIFVFEEKLGSINNGFNFFITVDFYETNTVKFTATACQVQV